MENAEKQTAAKFKNLLSVLIAEIPEKGGKFVVCFDGAQMGGTLCLKAVNGNTQFKKGTGFYPGLTDNIEVPYPDIMGPCGIYNAFIDPCNATLPQQNDTGAEAVEFRRLFE